MDGSIIAVDDRELSGTPEGLDARLLAEHLAEAGGAALFVARDYARAGAFVQAFRFSLMTLRFLSIRRGTACLTTA